jgi:hypothetical protein
LADGRIVREPAIVRIVQFAVCQLRHGNGVLARAVVGKIREILDPSDVPGRAAG